MELLRAYAMNASAYSFDTAVSDGINHEAAALTRAGATVASWTKVFLASSSSWSEWWAISEKPTQILKHDPSPCYPFETLANKHNIASNPVLQKALWSSLLSVYAQ
jgi:hypothetical protein